MISNTKFYKMKREIKELQAKTHAHHCFIQHINRVIIDMGMVPQNKKSFSLERPQMQSLRDLDRIERIATIFRNAIIRIKDISPLICLMDFPKGACGDASLLLGYHLNKLGYDPVLYTTGYKGDHSHAWIQMEDLVIDITIDERVIVTRDDTRYQKFIVDLQRQPDLNAYDDYSRGKFLAAYDQIISNIEEQTDGS